MDFNSRPGAGRNQMTAAAAAHPRQKDWINIVFLMLTPILGIPVTALYTWKIGFEPWMLWLCVGMFTVIGLSVCAGYHRFFSHKSYECSPAVQAFYAFFGAMAAQNSILCWSSDHRVHHQYVDKDWDPYNIQRGFWWAHFLWVFYKPATPKTFANVPDLERNPVVRWQHRWYRAILLLGIFGIPTAIGALYGHPLAGLLWGGFLRVVITHHTTFFVNSLAHYVGKRNFNARVSARDNWVLALVTFGEGYHSFHHRFPADFRNGVRWYHWDPAKWLIQGLKAVGLASELRATAAPMIEGARLHAAVKQLESHIERAPSKLGEEIRRRIAAARETIEQAFVLWRQHVEQRASDHRSGWRSTRRRSHRSLKMARRQWRDALELLDRRLAA
jgi:stearoyl-CoA desaturase (delta-9 desaturase)